MLGVAMESSELAHLAQENTHLKVTIVHLETLVEKLQFQLAQFTRRQFDVSAEGLAQLGLWSPDETPAAEAARVPTTQVPAHERGKPVRRLLPEDLPRSDRKSVVEGKS